MSYGLNVYSANGNLYFSTEYSPFNFLGVVTGHTANKSGQKVFDLPAGRELVCYGAHLSVHRRIPGENSYLDNQSHVQFIISGSTVSWEYIDYQNYWDEHFEFAIIVFTRAV